jgi:hypothetical protein
MSNANTVFAIHGASVPTIGLVGNVLQVSGVSSLAYGAINLAGGANFVFGVLPVINQAPQVLGGQATGTTAAVVIPLGGQISGTPAAASIQRAPLGPVRFIDPANSTGFASDANTGATANNVPPGSGPILTIAHLNSLLFFRSLTGNTTITKMSDDATGVGLDISTLNIGSFALTWQDTPVTVHTGGTINAGTIAINPHAAAGGQRQVVHTSDLATFNPFVHTVFGGAATNPTRLIDNVTTSGAWVVTDTTPASPSVTQPVMPNGTIGTLTIGDAYHITRGGILTLANTSGPIIGPGGTFAFNDCAFTAGSVGPNINPGFDAVNTSPATYSRCSFLGTLMVSGTLIDCAFMSGASGSLTADIVAGLFVPTSTTGEVSGTIAMGGNTYVAQPTVQNTFQIGPSAMSQLFIFEQFGTGTGGIQIQDSVSNGIELFPGGGVTCEVLLWGNGNAGFGVSVRAGTSAAISESTTVPSVTGTLGDFAFATPGTGTAITVARAFDPATGAYTEAGGVATRTTTWAHFAASITPGGGFNFQAHCLEANAHLTGSD